MAHRSISGAPILLVPSRCLICRGSAATPWRRSNVTRASSPGSAGLALSIAVLTCVLQGVSLQACGCASNGCWVDGGPQSASRLAIARRDEARGHELAQQGDARGSERRCRRRGGGRAAWDDDVVARSAVEDVLPAAADQHVVSRAAGQHVVAGAADQDVVAVAAIGGELDARQSGRVDDVVAAKAIDDDAIVAPRSRRSSRRWRGPTP